VPIDKSLRAPGFRVLNQLARARLVSIDNTVRAATNRNDRPGQPNQLIFGFESAQSPQSDMDLILRGPRGFDFEEDCLSSIQTNANNVFGPNTETSWPPEYAKWPTTVAPTSCAGSGRTAIIRIPIGLLRGNVYVFRIGVRSNPMITPAWNRWTIEYNSKASEPFGGFPVWTADGLSVTPSSGAKSATGANVQRTVNPVTITFTPFNSVPGQLGAMSGGLIRVVCPS